MRAVWRAAQVRVAEERLLATLPELTLMGRAATGIARRCAQLLADSGGVYGRRVLLLVGAGNNGGDALFAGAQLAARGAQARAILLHPGRAHVEGLAEFRRAGGRVHAGPESTVDNDVDLVIDGIVGIGATGALRGPGAAAVEQVLSWPRRPIVVAVDVPSGVDVDTGAVPGSVLPADVTVTFACLKPAHVVGPAAPLCGLLDVVDIGVTGFGSAEGDREPAALVADRADVAGWLPARRPDSDKYTRGVAGLATGSAKYPGAALLSVGGALVGPAGMVRYAGPAAAEVVRAHPSVIVGDRVDGAGRVQAWLVGCGIGSDDRARAELAAVLASAVPAVVDADALTLLGEGAPAVRGRPAPTVITPHDREFARLAGAPPGEDRLAAARGLAARLGVTVLLKGDRTVVATPAGTAWANPTGTAALATAGSGDVLAGLLVSLLAGGLAADRAAVSAAYLHGLAGRRAAGPAGTAPVTAPDLVGALAAVIGSLANATGG